MSAAAARPCTDTKPQARAPCEPPPARSSDILPRVVGDQRHRVDLQVDCRRDRPASTSTMRATTSVLAPAGHLSWTDFRPGPHGCDDTFAAECSRCDVAEGHGGGSANSSPMRVRRCCGIDPPSRTSRGVRHGAQRFAGAWPRAGMNDTSRARRAAAMCSTGLSIRAGM
jgi:hypothetical protein